MREFNYSGLIDLIDWKHTKRLPLEFKDSAVSDFALLFCTVFLDFWSRESDVGAKVRMPMACN